MNKYIKEQLKSACCGCRACEQACPKNCISIKSDDEGFLFPSFNADACVGCGLCSKVCPIENPVEGTLPLKVYGTVSKDLPSLTKSSSGGVFYLLAKSIINRGGAVVGAILDLENRYLSHAVAHTAEDIIPMLGSKYISSDTNDTYKRTKDLLSIGKMVLYVGTPCQVAGLNRFLNKPYENLITCDLLCHGVPSQYVFKEFIDYLEEKHNGKVIDYKFRDKERNGWSITQKYEISKGDTTKSYYMEAGLSPYFYGFLRGKFIRESCYSCPYTKLQRTGDFTLADFWGVKQTLPNRDTSKGCSCVLVNSKKATSFLNSIKKDLAFLDEVTYEQAYRQNVNFQHPCPRPEDRDNAISDIRRFGFKEAAKIHCKNPREFKLRFKALIKRITRR